MNPIELGKAISEVGTPIITAIMLILVVGLIWYLIKRQTKREDKNDKIQEQERLFYRTLVNNDLKSLHQDNLKNSDLNNQSIIILKNIDGNQGKLCKLIEGVDKRINGRKQ